MDTKNILRLAIKKYKGIEPIPPRHEIAKDFKISDNLSRCVRFFLQYKNLYSSDKEYPENVDMNQKFEENMLTITTTSAKIKSEEELLDYANIDLNVWQVKTCELNSWEVTMGKKNTNTGKAETYTNFQVRVKLEKINYTNLSIKNQADQFCKFVKNHIPNFKDVNIIPLLTSDYVMEISLPDFHYGQLSWAPEVGQNYDTKIAAKLWLSAMKYYANIAKNTNSKKILLPFGHDWFNVNSAANTTFKGTPQDEDCRWKKTFVTGWMLIVQGIEIILSINPDIEIEIKVIPGNHDTERAFLAGEVIKVYYRNCEKITVDNSPVERKYIKIGENLLGLGHGDGFKFQELPIVMAMESKNEFSKTSYWEFHHGHFHHLRRLVQDVIDFKSIVVKGMPSLVPLNEYSKKHAYMSVRHGLGIVWDKKGGIKAEYPFYPQ